MQIKEIHYTERLVLRRLKLSDADLIFNSYASNSESVKFVSWPRHRSIDDTIQYLEYAIKSWDTGSEFSFAIEHHQTNDFLGCIGFVNENGRVFIGYILNPKMEGKGFATEAATYILHFLSKQPEIYRIWACCATENNASVRVLEKSGMIREGVVKDWIVFPNLNNEARDCHFFYYPLKRSSVKINL